jgi:NAD(P)-dependent dehydrogenase (short-subunit alcohol dehydrogenase family)
MADGPAELRFDGRVAIVTGSGSGLGRAHALALAARGAHVVVNDLPGDGDAGPAVETAGLIQAAGGSAIAHAVDIADEAGAASLIASALDRFGRLDVVVNNAGLLRSADFGEMTIELFDRVVAVNLRATYLVARAAWPTMAAQGYGRIVSTTSNSGLLGTAGSTAYAAAKAGVWGLTRSLALEGRAHGINVSAIAPIAYTAMSATSRIAPRRWRTGEGDDWSRRLDVAHVPPAMVWLAHEACTLTGEVWSVAGGRVARFVMGLTHGTVHDPLTAEQVRDDEAELLAGEVEEVHTRAADEGRALHARLLGPSGP